MRSYFQESPAYHTSDDNRDFITAPSIIAAVDACLAICRTIEANRVWRSTAPFGEPFFTRHDLAPTLSTPDVSADQQLLARRWLMNQADGGHDLIAIADRARMPLALLADQAALLAQAGLLVPETDHAVAQNHPA